MFLGISLMPAPRRVCRLFDGIFLSVHDNYALGVLHTAAVYVVHLCLRAVVARDAVYARRYLLLLGSGLAVKLSYESLYVLDFVSQLSSILYRATLAV